eukprot:gene1781-1946_t
MSKSGFHMLRNIGLQLKTGFLKSEPPGYDILKRFPPIMKPSHDLHRTKKVNVPYAQLYDRAVQRNPSYLSDRVYGAYSHQEPHALILAKRQYKYMQEGLDEEAAYKKALKYLSELENEAYVSLKKAIDTVKKEGATAPFVSDPTVAETIAHWQEKLKQIPYENLGLAEQGELDFFLQTKVLRWNEMERLQRMKDPLFNVKFYELLRSLFPVDPAKRTQKRDIFRSKFRELYLSRHGHNVQHMITAKPFYVEDYIHYFNKARALPDLRRWNAKDREDFSRWIVDTLAYGSALIDKTPAEMQQYLDAVRERFFPMVRVPSLAANIPAPSVDAVKAALYQNQIGYKAEGGKVYVKRFYRIPALLFPEQLCVVEIASNRDVLEIVLEDEAELHKKLAHFEVPVSHASQIQKILTQYKEYAATLPVEESVEVVEKPVELSVLDEILGSVKTEAPVEKKAAEVRSVGKREPENIVEYGTPEWQAMVEKYVDLPKNDYEKDMFELYGGVELNGLQDIRCEEDAMDFRDRRFQAEVLAKAKLEKKYEQKECARRKKDWKERGVWTKQIPRPVSPLIG